ncbi:MAG: hypothetical protein HGA61_05155 [Candidatus Moranbacteria bacterium]|nr:hypothetical protein [Candidatus Moranbacteria bacterium]
MYSPDNLQKINIPENPKKKEIGKLVYVKDDILPNEQEYSDLTENCFKHHPIQVSAGLEVLEIKGERARVSYGLGSQPKETWKELWVPVSKLSL